MVTDFDLSNTDEGDCNSMGGSGEWPGNIAVCWETVANDQAESITYATRAGGLSFVIDVART